MKRVENLKLKARILLVLAVGCVHQSGYASGIRIPESSAYALAAGNAIIADTGNCSASMLNPSLSVFLTQDCVMLGASAIDYRVDFQDQNTGLRSSTKQSTEYVPNAHYVNKINANYAMSLSINSPFGLKTEWNDNTFSGFGGIDLIEPSLTDIKLLAYESSIARKFDNGAISGGITYYDLRGANLNTQAVSINGEGHGVGWQVGSSYVYDKLSFGLTYRSGVTIDLDGNINVMGTKYSSAHTSVYLPEIIAAGVRYTSGKWESELLVDYTRWSKFKDINIVASNDTLFATNRFSWSDAQSARLSFQYNHSDNFSSIFGTGHVSSVISKQAKFSATVPDARRNYLSAGIKWSQADYDLNLSFMRVFIDERTFNSTNIYMGGDPNGTSAYNGKYDSKINLWSVSITKTFGE